MKRFEGRTALVTGGGSGIGWATALAFANEGANVVVADVVEVGGQKVIEAIHNAGGNAVFIKADISQANQVEELVKKTVSIYGRLDSAFNNAGIEGDYVPTADCTEDNWNRVIDIDLKGEWLCMKHEIRQMIKQGGGAIVNASSMAGLRGYGTRPAYTAAKWGIIGLTKGAANEYAKHGIRINAICPGAIPTPMTAVSLSDPQTKALLMQPMGRLGKPEEIAEAVLWLCSDAASYVTGIAMAVDGGLTL